MYKFYFLLLVVIVSCGTDEINLSGETPIKPSDFIQAFKVINTNFNAKDSNFYKFADSQKISIPILTNVVPDSIVKNWVGTEKKVFFKPIGRIEKNEETYLLMLIQKKKQNGLTVLVFDKKNTFITYKDLLIADDDFEKNYTHSIYINKEPTFTVAREKNFYNGELKFRKTGWALSNNKFITVVNESNENDLQQFIINPIDTLPLKNKYSGDYSIDDRNILSLRDGNNSNEYKFFLYIEKAEGKCVGELKGIMNLTDDTHAIYTANGDPCAIDFTLSYNFITMKEKGSCGNRRGMDCLFDDTFIKRKLTNKKFVIPETIVPKKQKKIIKKPIVPQMLQTDTAK